MLEFLFASVLALNTNYGPDNYGIPRSYNAVKKDLNIIQKTEVVPIKKNSINANNLDGDLFIGKNDLCPNVPGRSNGCPKIDLYRGSTQNVWTLKTLGENFETKEKTEIKTGDEIFVGFENNKTGEIFKASEIVTIKK